MGEVPRRVAVVTGATSGLGVPLARGLAAAGFHLVIVGRDPGRVAATRALLGGSGEAEIADLSEPASVAAAGEAIARRHGAVHLLVNNAGVMTRRREVSASGRERVLAVNHLAPFVLTRTLAASLAAASLAAAAGGGGGARIVNVGSRAHERAMIEPADLELRRGWGAMKAYCRSKLALTMQSFEWSRRLAADHVGVHVVHPGVVRTRLIRGGGALGIGWWLVAPLLLTPEQGAEVPLKAALAPEYSGQTGLYMKRSGPAAPNPLALDERLGAQVWAATEALAG